MREEVTNFFSRLVPRRTATIYFLFFISTLMVSIAVMNSSHEVFRSYTICHGQYEYDISIFVVLVCLQLLLSLLKVEHKSGKEEKKLGDATEPSHRELNSDNELIPKKQLSEHLDMRNIRMRSADNLAGVICDVFSGSNMLEVSPHNSGALGSSRSFDIGEKRPMDELRKDAAGMSPKGEQEKDELAHKAACIRHPFRHSRANFSICWNSLWVLFYQLLAFMAIHATLLASRIHGAIELNKYALETCSHLWYKFPLGMWSPRMRYPLLSESTFFLTYLSCTSFELVTRKSSDASYVKNFFGTHFWKDCPLIGTLRIVLQCVIFVYGASSVVMSMVYGYGSPMQIVTGFSMGMMMLWINAALTQLLQLSHVCTSTLELNWFWSLLSLLNIWICGILFYITVYGIPFTATYTYLQIFCWFPLLILTKRKGKKIFVWRDIPYALYTFNQS